MRITQKAEEGRCLTTAKHTKHSSVEMGDFPDTCSISHTFTQPYKEQ